MKVHAGCGSIYLKGYINIDVRIPGVTFLAKDRPDLVKQNLTMPENYYKKTVVRGDIETKRFESQPIVVDMFGDVRNLPFPQNSLSEIRAVQLFEHFTFQEGEALLEHWQSLLEAGGKIHLDIPDLDGTIQGYVEAKAQKDKDWYIRLLYGSQKNEFGLHKAMYSKITIKGLLRKKGFKNIIFLPNIHFYPAFAVEGQK